MPWAAIPFSSCSSDCVGWRNMRAERSAAMMVRASPSRVVWNESLKPRTPVRAATPMATDRITKRNFAREACSSRQAIFAAEAQVNEGFAFVAISGGPLHLVFHDHAVAQNNAAVGVGRHLSIVRHQY